MLELILMIFGGLFIFVLLTWLLTLFLIMKIAYQFDQDEPQYQEFELETELPRHKYN